MSLNSSARPQPLRRRARDAARALLHGAVIAAAARRGRGPAFPAGPRRVLLLREDALGDMLMSTSLLRAIAAARPDVRVDVLASRVNAPAIAGAPWVNEVLVAGDAGALPAARSWRMMRAARYDAVVDGVVMDGLVRSRRIMLMAASGAPVRIGCAAPWVRNPEHFTHGVLPPADDAHHVEVLAALGGPLGVRPGDHDWRPLLALGADEVAAAEHAWAALGAAAGGGRRRLLVNVSAGCAARRWPDARFVAALTVVRDRFPDVTVAVVGLPADRASVELAAAAAGGGAPATPHVRAAFALAASADAVFTPDTSVAHAASTVPVPVVVMMPCHMRPFEPYRTPGVAVYGHGRELACIGVAPVVDALGRVLGGGPLDLLGAAPSLGGAAPSLGGAAPRSRAAAARR